MGRFIGIEIDSARLRVAEIEENGKKQRMLQCFSFPVPQGMVEDGEIRDTGNVADLLLDGLEAHNIRTKKVFFVAGSSRIANRRLKIPMVKKKQIQSLLEENSSEYFPIDLSKYVLSYTIMRGQQTGSSSVCAHGLCGPQEHFHLLPGDSGAGRADDDRHRIHR